MKRFLPLLLLFAIGCTDSKSFQFPTSKAAADSTDTTNYAVTDTTRKAVETIEAPEGFYQVILPCAGCKGTEHTVSFRPDLSFHLEETGLGKPSATIKTDGNWKPAAAKIWLYKNDSVKARYTWQGDTLLYLESSGNAIPMQKLTAVTDDSVWKARSKTGIEFFGAGTEPFWSIEVDKQKQISLQLADWATSKKFKPLKPVAAADSIIYGATTDSVALSVIVYNTFCTDGMSENIYPNKVKVFYNKQVYSGCGVLYRKFQ